MTAAGLELLEQTEAECVIGWRLRSLGDAGYGFGVTYVRRRVAEDPEHAWSVFGYIVEGFRMICTQLLETTDPVLGEKFLRTYGLEPEQIWEETMIELRRRLHSIRLDDV